MNKYLLIAISVITIFAAPIAALEFAETRFAPIALTGLVESMQKQQQLQSVEMQRDSVRKEIRYFRQKVDANPNDVTAREELEKLQEEKTDLDTRWRKLIK